MEEKNAIIIVGADQDLSAKVQRLAFKTGYSWYGGQKEVIPTGTNIQPGIHSRHSKTMLHGNEIASVKRAHPDWSVIDAATEWAKVCEFFGVDPNQKLTIREIVPPRLLDLITNQPGQEMVPGFIRRDLGLNLPDEVQVGGSKAILDWILEQKQGSVPEQFHPVAKKDNKFKVVIQERVQSRQYMSRTDLVTVEMEVPDDVIQRALEEEDSDVITDWITDEWNSDHEISRNEGEEDYGDSDATERSFEGIEDATFVRTKLAELEAEQDNE